MLYEVITLMIVLGIRILGFRIASLRKTFYHSFIIAIWFSITMGFLFIDSVDANYLLLGGAHGYFMSKWMVSAIGNIGLAIVLIAILLTYLSVNFESFYLLRNNFV